VAFVDHNYDCTWRQANRARGFVYNLAAKLLHRAQIAVLCHRQDQTTSFLELLEHNIRNGIESTVDNNSVERRCFRLTVSGCAGPWSW